jgi:CubicO group peptidase (beta-lactamase class C family)
MFDLASLSKVFGTGMCLMKAIDSGLIDPEKAVVEYLPEMNNKDKDKIKVKHLLMHNSGMHAYSSPQETAEKTWQSIAELPLARSIGDYRYSCLNFISLMKVLESVTGEPMWKFYRDEFTIPLKMSRTMYSPDEKYKDQCMPTVGDSSGSKILKQGEVHDPLALSLEGYSGNAGVFSTASDLAKLCQLMMNKGVYDAKPFVSEEVWEKFATVQSGSRTWAWSVNNYKSSSAGDLMKETAIGHTGYTGTSAWLDLDQDIFVILLTNRVYPQDKKAVNPVRRAVADAALKNFIQD